MARKHLAGSETVVVYYFVDSRTSCRKWDCCCDQRSKNQRFLKGSLWSTDQWLSARILWFFDLWSIKDQRIKDFWKGVFHQPINDSLLEIFDSLIFDRSRIKESKISERESFINRSMIDSRANQRQCARILWFFDLWYTFMKSVEIRGPIRPPNRLYHIIALYRTISYYRSI